MTQVVRSFPDAVLELVESFCDDRFDAAAARALVADLDRIGWQVDGYRLFDDAEGRHVSWRIAGMALAPLLPANLPGISLLLEVADAASEPNFELVDDGALIELRGLRLTFAADPGLLRPLDPSQPSVRLVFPCAARIARDGSLALVAVPRLTVPPSEVGTTGLIVSLDGLQIDAAARVATADIGTLRLLPMCRFAGAGGLAAEAHGLQISAAGVTALLRADWPFSHDGRNVDGAAVGTLFDSWSIGIASAAIEIVDNLPRVFWVAGALRLPLLDVVLDIELGLVRDGESFTTTVHGQLASALDRVLPGSRLRVATMTVDGRIGSDHLEASGTADGVELSLATLVLSIAGASVSVSHTAERDELSIALGRVTLGPLGVVDDARARLIDERRDGTTSLALLVAASLEWSTLRARLSLPANLPAPTAGRAEVRVELSSDGAGGERCTLVVEAAVDDLGSAWSALPASIRPSIESAVLRIAVDYGNSAAFATGSTSGPLGSGTQVQVDIAVVVTLPASIGDVVTLGDPQGRVHARLRLRQDAGAPPAWDIVLDDLMTVHVRPPARTGSAAPSLLEATLATLVVAQGDRADRASLTLAGALHAATPQLRQHLNASVAAAGLPVDLSPIVEPLTAALPDEGAWSLVLEADGGTTQLTFDASWQASDPPSFAPLQLIGRIVDPSGGSAAGAGRGVAAAPDFFAVTPGPLRMTISAGSAPRLVLSASLLADLFGERFDATIALDVSSGDFRLTLAAGTSDPILLRVPLPDTAVMLGVADVASVAARYALDATQRALLQEVHDTLVGLGARLADQGVFAFEIADFGLHIGPTGPSASGTVRLVQVPRWLEVLTPLNVLRLTLGAEVDRIFISIDREGGNANAPLVVVPLPGGEHADVFFGRFLFSYVWAHNEFAFALDAGVEPSRTWDLTVGSGVVLPAVRSDVEIGVTASAPPVPLPQGWLSFERQSTGSSVRAIDQLGLQAVIGVPGQRLVTAYLREVAFSPTYFLVWPGFKGDGGLVLGGPDPATRSSATQYLDVRTWDRSAFFARFTVQRGCLILIDPTIGALLNPMALVPPFVTANPPYWVTPPLLMGDLFADEIAASVNLPGLFFADVRFARPLPAFSLQALLELAALVAGGFSQPIPADSALRDVFFTRLTVRLEVALLGFSTAPAVIAETLEVNVVDFVNATIDLMHKAKATLEAGSDLIGAVAEDPGALVRMVPLSLRRHAHEIRVAGFRFSGSVQLLTPEELRDELMLYFENRRRRARGLAANRTSPRPPGGLGINVGGRLRDVLRIDRLHQVDLRAVAPDLSQIAERAIERAWDGHRNRKLGIDALLQRRRQSLEEAAGQIAQALATARPNEPVTRARLLTDFGLKETAAAVEQAIAAARGRSVGTVQAALATVLVAAMQRHGQAMVGNPALPRPADEIADQLLSRVTAQGPRGSAVVAKAQRQREIERLAPPELTGLRGELGQLLDQLERRGTGSAAVSDARRDIASALDRAAGVRRVGLADLHGADLDRSAIAARVHQSGRASWRGVPRTTSVLTDVRLLDAEHFADVLGKVDPWRRPAPGPDTTVRAVTGYVIRARDGSGFSVPIEDATALYTVAVRAGRAFLRVRRPGRQWSEHELPASLVARASGATDRARALRDLLQVAPHVVQRPRTAAERDAVAEQFDQSPTLYQTSLFMRPEYQVKPEGGVHGPMTLADLLRTPPGSGYTVPAGPAFLGGFSASVMGNTLRMAGLVVGGDEAPSLFLYGHQRIAFSIGALTFEAQGDFAAGAGDAFASLPLPTGAVTASAAIGFSGHLKVRQGSRTVLEGSASGSLSLDSNARFSATFDAYVAAEGSHDLGLGDTEFARVGWSFEGRVAVEVSPQHVSIDVAAEASVTADLATYETRWVVDVPSERVCVPFYYVDSIIPPAGHWGSACATTPEVGHPEVDFDTVHWQRLAAASCGVSATVSNQGVSFALDLDGLGNSATSILGVHRITFGALAS